MTRVAIIAALGLVLAGCQTRTVIKEVPVEVKVPVTVPCMGLRPDLVEPLNSTITPDEWEALSTDQRAALLAAQSLAWKILSWQALDASAGCR